MRLLARFSENRAAIVTLSEALGVEASEASRPTYRVQLVEPESPSAPAPPPTNGSLLAPADVGDGPESPTDGGGSSWAVANGVGPPQVPDPVRPPVVERPDAGTRQRSAPPPFLDRRRDDGTEPEYDEPVTVEDPPARTAGSVAEQVPFTELAATAGEAGAGGRSINPSPFGALDLSSRMGRAGGAAPTDPAPADPTRSESLGADQIFPPPGPRPAPAAGPERAFVDLGGGREPGRGGATPYDYGSAHPGGVDRETGYPAHGDRRASPSPTGLRGMARLLAPVRAPLQTRPLPRGAAGVSWTASRPSGWLSGWGSSSP
jgi:hypothetical protein